MRQIVEAVYESGILKPDKPLDLNDGQRVRLEVDTNVSDDPLALAASVYDGLSEQEVSEVERIALERRELFEGRPVK